METERPDHEVRPRRSRSARSPLGRESGRWSARNHSRGAMLTETVRALEYLAAGHSVGALRTAIVEQDLLGKRTSHDRRTCWRLLSSRYLHPPVGPAISMLTSLMRTGADDHVVRGALYFHFCLADRLAFEVATDLLWSLDRRGREIVRPSEVEDFVRQRAADHPEVLTWAQTTHQALATKLLSAFRDFGRLTGVVTKRLAQPPLPDTLLLYVCAFLAAEGQSARDIVGAPDFRLWGMSPGDVGTRLARMSQCQAIRFEWSGDIAVLDLGERTFPVHA